MINLQQNPPGRKYLSPTYRFRNFYCVPEFYSGDNNQAVLKVFAHCVLVDPCTGFLQTEELENEIPKPEPEPAQGIKK
jgi:hypothetical protein